MSATFVLDSSVAVAWCFPVQSTELSHRALQELQMGGTAWVRSLFAIEVANAMTRSVRLGAISPSRADEFASDLLDLPLEFELTAAGHALGKVRALASRLNLSAYDAIPRARRPSRSSAGDARRGPAARGQEVQRGAARGGVG